MSGSRMKKAKKIDAGSAISDELRPEYKFDYQKARPNRFANHTQQQPCVITLDFDVSRVFTTSESVNTVLRALIETMPRNC
jgi:hypothetical protein